MGSLIRACGNYSVSSSPGSRLALSAWKQLVAIRGELGHGICCCLKAISVSEFLATMSALVKRVLDANEHEGGLIQSFLCSLYLALRKLAF